MDQRRQPQKFYSVISLALLACGAGCAQLATGEDFADQIQAATAELAFEQAGQLPTGAVSLETCVMRFPADDETLYHQLWQKIDEQRLTLELRNELSANGLRLGIISGHLPEEIRRYIDEDLQATGLRQEGAQLIVGHPEVESSTEIWGGHIPIGEPTELMKATRRDSQVVFTRDEQGRVSGKNFRDVTALIQGVVQPTSAGGAALRITPELLHGQARQRHVTQNNAILLKNGQDRQRFENLVAAVELAPGEILAMTCLPETSLTVGAAIFSQQAEGRPREQTLLLVRLAQTQHDSLFAPLPDETVTVTDDPLMAGVAP